MLKHLYTNAVAQSLVDEIIEKKRRVTVDLLARTVTLYVAVRLADGTRLMSRELVVTVTANQVKNFLNAVLANAVAQGLLPAGTDTDSTAADDAGEGI